VQRAGAVLGERTTMFGCSVAFVVCEAVVGVLEIELAAEAVAMDLCDDRGGGDGEAERVTVVELGLRAGVVDDHGVDDEVVGREGKLLHGEEHGHA